METLNVKRCPNSFVLGCVNMDEEITQPMSYLSVYTFGVAVHPRSSVDRVSDEAVAGELVSYDSGDDRS